MDGLFPDDKEQVHHELIQFGSGVIVAKERKVVLAEHAKTVHSQFVDQEQHLRYILCDLLLKFSNHLENIVIAEDSVHPDDYFPHDDKNILFNLNVD
jgi:hypothetical protein